MRNIGNSDAKFQLAVQEPFFVTPDSGRLTIGESMQIHVDFKALQTGDHSSHMILQYETGKDTCMNSYTDINFNKKYVTRESDGFFFCTNVI